MSNSNGTSRKSPTPGDTQDGRNPAKEIATRRTTSSDHTNTTTSNNAASTSAAAAAAAVSTSAMTDDDNQDNHSDERNRKKSKRVMHISSDEINVLVYRYLQEAGRFFTLVCLKNVYMNVRICVVCSMC
jgi:hypothetical protein